MKEKLLDNTPIHYWINDNKSKETIMFIHPAFANHTCFDFQFEHFKDNYKVIAMDLLGHGKSIGKGTIVDTSEFIKEIMIKENINKINLVGVSIGALLIQDFANKYPNKVASLCCIGGYDINNFDSSIQKENRRKQMKMMLKAVFSIKAFAKDNKKISAYTKEAQDRFYEMNLEFRKSSFKQLASLNGIVNKFQIEKREYPLMIGVGEYDIDLAIKVAKMWRETEPNCKFVIFNNAGHIVNMDVPNEFNSTLEDFLRPGS
ncbi:alpha/beta hydrolase [Sporosarcina sp. ACRSL]|uniref:alpha/beta fold hydrolase n=1 Tax=Sporosarcina sp. ACRSL TaxID=2918215 RepID=UPI001EF44E82|nr:alpha/beta hydrolase [Sporosarcina sp. ACRSL]MCG7344810.1 alpha/beta hydrolase [Sporosarcina sp. ACRSL]